MSTMPRVRGVILRSDVVEIGLPGVFLVEVISVEADAQLGQHG